jgi:hypothetical protein
VVTKTTAPSHALTFTTRVQWVFPSPTNPEVISCLFWESGIGLRGK